jgi:1-acyl-sn-glycerol-3-phosphate acyltransferase
VADIAESVTTGLAAGSIRAACRLAVRRIDLRVEGLQNVPTSGPVLIAARHFHHFFDGCALLAVVPRPLHVVVTLDWLRNPIGHLLLTAACHAAGWPVVPRPDHRGVLADGPAHLLFPSEVSRLRAAARQSAGLLRAGEALLVFPEGYPNIDPGCTPKTSDDAFLPFRPGFLRFVALAERDRLTRVALIPAGLEYSRDRRWSLTLRFGTTIAINYTVDLNEQVRGIEEQVRQLSGLPPPSAVQ